MVMERTLAKDPLPKEHCQNCKHSWTRRKDVIAQCPNCGDPYFRFTMKERPRKQRFRRVPAVRVST